MNSRDDDWQPATSEPGELFTVEGQLRASRNYWRNVKSDEPRARKHRRTIARQGWWFLGIAIAIPAVAILFDILF